MYEYKAKLDRVIDGDTIDVIIDLGFKMTTNQRVRFLDIDTDEIHSVKHDTEEYKRGLITKKFVEKRFAENGNEFIVRTRKGRITGKYGRYLCEIVLGDNTMTLNEQLNKEGYAKKL
ncbi:MAG: thermonuclease family protein [Mariniphaga sp.]|nr:thermonuclease family protein [Mariniphaga sp.]